jgi:hypothetical protein
MTQHCILTVLFPRIIGFYLIVLIDVVEQLLALHASSVVNAG